MKHGPTGGRAVAIGGGTGLPRVLRCLIADGYKTTAVVTMADDGGSSGALRRELGMLPPGDVRNCLVAMGDAESPLGRLFQYRFPHGEGLAGHTLGNLIIAALADITGSFPAAIEAAGSLVGTHGRVLPCTLEDVALHAEDVSGTPIAGQALIAQSCGPFAHVTLEPEVPAAYPPVLEAIAAADVIVIGPGSLYTSIIPNFLVAGVAEAVRASSARRVYVCNVANQRGETSDMDAEGHVRALFDHGLAGAIDVVIVHGGEDAPAGSSHPGGCEQGVPYDVDVVRADREVCARIEALGPAVHVADLVDPAQPLRHDPARLCRTFGEVF
jgi:uncharacterized cofD-like protein